MSERRLPVYLVLDVSGSMSGEPIEAVRTGIQALLMDLRGDPVALETAYLSVITFSSTAQQVCQLTDLLSFAEPVIEASGSTSMGEAIRVLMQCFDRDLTKSTAEKKGDYKPLVFIMTDGQPTDSWENAADELKARRTANIIACAAGPGADANILKRITENVVQLNNLQPDTLKAFFKWVSSSIKTTSSRPDVPDVDVPPPVNQDFVIVP